MFGVGVYLADHLNKSIHYMKGSTKIIVIKVYLGKTLELIKSDKTLNQKKLRGKGFDLVYSRVVINIDVAVDTVNSWSTIPLR